MEIKKCLNSEVPTPSNGYGYFYLDQETSKLKLKKSTETISWDLVGVAKYKDVDAETARLCHILENDDTEGYEAKVLVKFDNSCTSIPLLESESFENHNLKKWDAIKTSDGQFYTDDKTLVHTFADDCTDKYIICYYHNNTSSNIYVGDNWTFIPDGEEYSDSYYFINYTTHAIYFNFDFYDSWWSCKFFSKAGFGYYSSITFLDCNFEHVNELSVFAFGEDRCNDLYILNEQTNNALNFINVQTFNDLAFYPGPKFIHGTIECGNSLEKIFSSASLIICPYINTSNVYYFGLMFSGAAITSVPLLDLTNAINCDYMFGWCNNLRYLGGFKGLKVDLSLTESPLLVRASLLNVLNNLADVTELGTNPTLTLAADSYHKLTAEEIAIGTNKGWTIAYA
jgi:hypothetical protein